LRGIGGVSRAVEVEAVDPSHVLGNVVVVLEHHVGGVALLVAHDEPGGTVGRLAMEVGSHEIFEPKSVEVGVVEGNTIRFWGLGTRTPLELGFRGQEEGREKDQE